ncbi:MAG: hypothetical protein V9G13_05355 [Marmoricola sp.]
MSSITWTTALGTFVLIVGIILRLLALGRDPWQSQAEHRDGLAAADHV